MLEALRPKVKTDLKQLTRQSSAQNQHTLYPSALKEIDLLCLARDLRLVERLSLDADMEAPLAPPLYIVCELLMRPGTAGHASGELNMTNTALIRAIKVLQSAIEREIVSRIVGVNSEIDEDHFFLNELDLSQEADPARS